MLLKRPVIAVTASVILHSEREVLNAGFAAYQRKPLDITIILDAGTESA